MSALDVVDDLFLAVAPAVVAAELVDPARWRRWWPDLDLTVVQDRGDQGMRWAVAGASVGTLEVWLEPVLDGTVLHQLLHLQQDPALVEGDRRRVDREVQRRRRVATAVALELKARLERGRPPGHRPPPRG